MAETSSIMSDLGMVDVPRSSSSAFSQSLNDRSSSKVPSLKDCHETARSESAFTKLSSCSPEPGWESPLSVDYNSTVPENSFNICEVFNSPNFRRPSKKCLGAPRLVRGCGIDRSRCLSPIESRETSEFDVDWSRLFRVRTSGPWVLSEIQQQRMEFFQGNDSSFILRTSHSAPDPHATKPIMAPMDGAVFDGATIFLHGKLESDTTEVPGAPRFSKAPVATSPPVRPLLPTGRSKTSQPRTYVLSSFSSDDSPDELGSPQDEEPLFSFSVLED